MDEYLNILKQGVKVWNEWRQKHPLYRPDLREISLFLEDPYAKENLIYRENHLYNFELKGVDLSGINFREVKLRNANLEKVILHGANLEGSDLTKARLRGARLEQAILFRSNFNEAELIQAKLDQARIIASDFRGAVLSFATIRDAELVSVDLRGANLYETDLSRSYLTHVDLRGAVLIETNLNETTLTDCSVYGVSAWKLRLEGAKQSNMIIKSPDDEPAITVDDLELAQFIYLLLNNKKIRDVIDTIGHKGVLILGRFSKERKLILDALREKLRTLNYVPIIFDFERPTERDFTETILTLAGLSCFIIADITNPKSSPLELQATVPNYMIPFVPLLQEGEQPFAMFRDLKGKYDWVLDLLVYDTPSNLVKGLERAVIKPALERRAELLAKKVEQLRTRHIGEYI